MILELPSKYVNFEYAVWTWAGSLYLEELRNLFYGWRKAKYAIHPWKNEYFNSYWNIYDLCIFWILVAAAILRSVHTFEHIDNVYGHVSDSTIDPVLTDDYSDLTNLSSDIYAVAFICYVMRLLQYFYILESFGPKIMIIFKMIKDLLFFLLMFALFLFAFGIAFHALVHPDPSGKKIWHLDSDQTFDIFKHLIYIPYFIIFQQYDDLSKQIENCTKNYTVADYQAGQAKCSHLAAVFYIVYVLVTSLLLVNLLIASFSSSYEQVAKDARKTWLYYRFEVIEEYINKPTLPSPFIVFNHIFRLIVFVINVCRRNSAKVERKEHGGERGDNEVTTLKEIEKDAFDRVNDSGYRSPDDPHEDELLTSIKITLKEILKKKPKKHSSKRLSGQLPSKIHLPSTIAWDSNA